MDELTFERNLLALSDTSREAIALLTRSVRRNDLTFETAKTGEPVPVFLEGNSRKPLHSLFNPVREAEKIAEWHKDWNFFIVFGLGGGYHVRKLLERNDVTGVLVFDTDADFMRTTLSGIDLTDILGDRRFRLVLDATPEAAVSEIIARYLPSVSGDFSLMSLRPREELAKDYFGKLHAALGSALNSVKADYSVQAFFGAAWFRNIIRNLSLAERSFHLLPAVHSAIVTAAGPSLEDGLDEIAELPGKSFVVATDTSLPVLLGAGITPDVVVSIDCQHISYNHFMCGYPSEVPLLMDLASPPLLGRMSRFPVFFASGHPLCRYAAARLRSFPELDTSGGNVTHAAVSLADALGADDIRLYGADFSYPEGKCYARGTYLYPWFAKRSLRTLPLEAEFFSFLLRNPDIARETDGHGTRYVTKPLGNYRKSLENAAERLRGRLVPVRGGGSEIRVRQKPGGEPGPRELFAAGPAKTDTPRFLEEYRADLESIRFGNGTNALDPVASGRRQHDVLTTILPVAAWIGQKNRGEKDPGRNMEDARDYCVSFMDKMGLGGNKAARSR